MQQNPDSDWMGEQEVESERSTSLPMVFLHTGAKLIYTYDFGDGWDHSVVLEKQLPAGPLVTYPICVDGKLACPPEDCGGVFGFYERLKSRDDPGHPDHEQSLEWLGGAYKAEAFSLEQINKALARGRGRKKQIAE